MTDSTPAAGPASQIFAAACCAAILASLGVLYVHDKVAAVDEGYRLGVLDRDRQALERENLALKVQLATLRSSQHIEAQARSQLGMVAPTAQAIISLQNGPSPSPSAESRVVASRAVPHLQGRAAQPHPREPKP
jgi:cell division protein FtsL